MVRVDRDLKRCYFYRIKIDGDVQKPADIRSPSLEFPKSGIPRQDIIPYNPHIRTRTSRLPIRPSSSRRISWSREADRVREISPRSEPEPIRRYDPPYLQKSQSFSDDWPEKTYPIAEKKSKKKKKTPMIKPKSVKTSHQEPVLEPVFVPIKPKKSAVPIKSKVVKPKEQIIRQQREQRYRAQKTEQMERTQHANSNLRKVKSESNLKKLPNDTLMRKADAGKTKHFNPPRWRHVGDRNRRRQGDKNSRSFASDYYF
ncbi:uncharacterized protein CELE_Y60A9.1 [Caenorhabditis elegans]|uniref:Uncharacterized protein n=1 Tax=Caenorhabditis elegans TaxID=6239 RepID=Q9U1Y4_CAEEL|nr:Uncharacterized protein CELE_Y60A9.1 [Caenorhabditis elegans]CAB60408.2 Uncharacterized protein CELE_Y60A9.1 [Caenorhabditis elegans]|eukprot:NP_001355368.1 Uncharacterized protein CELE_Y60A9.1 [Caenorhabditis elegans]